jgi:uncharacterized protein (DUF1778 family)
MEDFMATTERIPLLVTPAQKALFIKKAKASKLTVNEFIRRAAEVYNPSDDDEALIRLVAQVKQTTHEATAALDAALKSCADSNRRIADMETRGASGNKRLPRPGRDD